MRELKAIWFDLDDTLFDHTYSVCRGLEAVCLCYPVLAGRPTEELAVLYNRALNTVYTGYLRGAYDLREMRRRKLELFYEAAGVDGQAPPLDEFHRIYDEAYGMHRRAVPGSVELLHHLRERGLEMAILTNGTQAIQQSKLRTMGLEWMIPNLVTSDRAGAPKPDSRIYEWALEYTGQRAANVLMVGDSLENDVEAALRCGLTAALFAPAASQEQVSTIHGEAPIIREWRALVHLISQEPPWYPRRWKVRSQEPEG